MNAPDRSRSGLPVLAIIAITGALYAPVRGYPFVVFDDLGWIVDNPLVNGGLSWHAVGAAFTTAVQGNWVPLTWLSHQLDVTLFGLDAGAHHAVNVLLHIAAAAALFVALRRATGEYWTSAFVAMAFAIHPLHVESVAWVSERRDVLSGLFFALCLGAWARHAQEGGRGAYLAALASFAAGALAKPMLVTLPVVLLVLDGWPLRRTGLGARRLLLEKLPFAAVAGGVALATLATQSGVGAIASLEMLPVGARVANALTSLSAYLVDTAWPSGLAVFYPYPDAIDATRVAAATVLLIGVTTLFVREATRRPWLLAGWSWFGITLLPVIGLIQVGSQARADRYMYLPIVGLLLAAAFSAAELARRDSRMRVAVISAGLAWLLLCGGLASRQITTWRDSVALFEHARAVSGDAPIILVNLGEAYERDGDTDRAIALYQTGLADYAHAPRVRTRLGRLLIDRGRLEDALRELQEALQRHPDEPRTRYELGRLLLRNAQYENAVALLEEEENRFPGADDSRFHLAEARAHTGERDVAVRAVVALLRANPAFETTPIEESPRSAEMLAEAHTELDRAGEALHWTKRGLLLSRLAGDDEVRARLEPLRAAREKAAAEAEERGKPHP